MNNTLKYVKVLEGAGISREQAEAHVQLVTEIMEGDLATKQDILNLESETRSSLSQLEAKLGSRIDRLDQKIDAVAERFEHKLLQMEYRMTIKLGTIVTVAIAASTAIIKIL